MSDIKEHIQSQINANDIMVFMKGTPQFPQCGFSSTVVQILDYLGVDHGAENVLASDDLRQGIKEFSDWPTIPQLYVKGEFVGGVHHYCPYAGSKAPPWLNIVQICRMHVLVASGIPSLAAP